jgi:hypothetical protein
MQRSRGLLPDTGSAYEGPAGGNIGDALDFLLSNFVEMNKLWVRMQHQVSLVLKYRWCRPATIMVNNGHCVVLPGREWGARWPTENSRDKRGGRQGLRACMGAE